MSATSGDRRGEDNPLALIYGKYPRPISIRVAEDSWRHFMELLGLDTIEELDFEFRGVAIYCSKHVPRGQILVLWPPNWGYDLIRLPKEGSLIWIFGERSAS